MRKKYKFSYEGQGRRCSCWFVEFELEECSNDMKFGGIREGQVISVPFVGEFRGATVYLNPRELVHNLSSAKEINRVVKRKSRPFVKPPVFKKDCLKLGPTIDL